LRRLFVFNGGFLTERRVRRILRLAGHEIRLGWPGPDDLVALWGQRPTSRRGLSVAARTGAGVLHVEDAFLRSVRPGRAGDPPLGLHLDRQGVHFDGSAPSDLETLLATHPLNDPALIARAEAAVMRLRAGHLSKYNAFDPAAPVPAPGFVLVIDQTLGDASVRASGADRDTFRRMLATARAEHPDRLIVVKSHPETSLGLRAGHLDTAGLPPKALLLRDPVSPWALLDHAAAVYTLSSQMGFEAILAGHRPVVLHHFTDHRGRQQARHAGEIAAGFGVAGAHENAAVLCLQGKDMTRLHKIGRLGVAGHGRLHRACTIGRADARGDARGRFDGHGEGGAVARAVAAGHGWQLEPFAAFAGERQTDQAARMAGHEVDGLRAHVFRRQHQITFVLAILFVNQDDHAAGSELGNEFGYR
jgi:hypothetical protein